MREVQNGTIGSRLGQPIFYRYGPWLVGLSFILDRTLKSLAPPSGPANWFSFVRSVNLHGPFSLPLPTVWLIGISALVLIVLLWLVGRAARVQNYRWLIPILLMLVGGLSNLFDRLTQGGVVDVFTLAGVGTFNLADVYLGVGLIWLLAASC